LVFARNKGFDDNYGRTFRFIVDQIQIDTTDRDTTPSLLGLLTGMMAD
jgi:hypothetical protein